MGSLHIQNVPDELMERLQRLAEAANISIDVVVIRGLDAVTRRADNAALLATLSDLDIPPATIVDDIQADRR